VSKNVIEIPDEGMINVQIAGGTFQFDAYKVHNSLLSIREKIANEEKPVEDFHQAAVDYFAGLGLPPLTHFQADCLIARLQQAVTELGKALMGEPMQCSPTCSEPAPSSSPAA